MSSGSDSDLLTVDPNKKAQYIMTQVDLDPIESQGSQEMS
jgi:hypothetical protein